MKRTVLISGGTGGIGEACVRCFAAAGYAVLFLTHERPEKADRLTAELRASGASADWRACDLADPLSVTDALNSLKKTWHHIDVLINNAGVSHVGLLTGMTVEEWDRVMNINLRGAFLLTKEVLPDMISCRQGSVINISSMWGETGASCEVAYSASKAGLIGFTKALAKEVGLSGVRVNCLTPGVIRTEMNRNLRPEDLDALKEETPLERLGDPEDVAKAALFLAGEEASFITGQVLGVNGGFVI